MAGKGGKRAGAGRKPKQQEINQADYIARNLPEERLNEVLNRMIDIALTGGEKAAVSAGSMLLAYALGKPKERVEHSNPDGTALLSPIADALTKVYGATATPANE